MLAAVSQSLTRRQRRQGMDTAPGMGRPGVTTAPCAAALTRF